MALCKRIHGAKGNQTPRGVQSNERPRRAALGIPKGMQPDRQDGWRNIGTFVTLERNRCIQCSRCDRFTREITGTNEFGMFFRGHELTVDTYADRPMTNKFQGNMADICPVGAITEKEFRFKRRVWKLKKNRSICTGCSTGCNVTVEHDRNEVFRLKPLENHYVNKWWLCDEGRLSYRKMNEKKSRINQPYGRVEGNLEGISWNEAYSAISDRISEMSPMPNEVLALTNTHASNEELYLIKSIIGKKFSSNNVFCPLPSWEQVESNFFINTIITSDKSPNRAGALANEVNGDEKSIMLKKIIESNLKLVIVLGDPYLDELEIYEKLKKSQLLVYIGAFKNKWCEIADIVLPGQYYSEKEGTYTNKNQIIQYTEIAVKALRRSRPEWQILSELYYAIGLGSPFKTLSEVFNTMTSEVKAFSGIKFEDIKENGTELKNKINDPGMRLVKAN